MSVNPVEAIGAVDTYTTFFTRPSQDASGIAHIALIEQLDAAGRTMSVSESTLLVYDRFANLQTIPSQRDQTTTSVTA